MIGANKAFIRSMHYFDVQEKHTKILYVFSGTLPTQAEIKALADADPDFELRIGDVISFASGRGDSLLHVNAYDTLNPVYLSETLMEWQLSLKPEEFIHLNDGQIGWFVFGSLLEDTGRSTIESGPASLNDRLHFSYIGTAGDENSSSDLGLLTGTVTGSKDYSITDLRVNYL